MLAELQNITKHFGVLLQESVQQYVMVSSVDVQNMCSRLTLLKYIVCIHRHGNQSLEAEQRVLTCLSLFKGVRRWTLNPGLPVWIL